MPPFAAAIATLALVGAGLLCHRRLRAIFPEDAPTAHGRHRHAEPTPMAGFLPAIVALLGLATLAPVDPPSAWLLAAVFVAGAIGYLDDRGKAEGHDMKWWHKAIGLCGAAGCAVGHFAVDPGSALAWTDLLMVFGFVFLTTNAVNFLDNTNGVATAAGATALLLATGGSGPLAFAGFAFLGFLPFNWPRALAFLGDSGSLSLGVCVAVAGLEFAIHSQRPELPWLLVACLPLLVFVLDFVQVVTARLIIGVPPWEGDRRHLTHILGNLGVPSYLIAPLFAGAGLAGFYVLR